LLINKGKTFGKGTREEKKNQSLKQNTSPKSAKHVMGNM
jgi:hypothetical protein